MYLAWEKPIMPLDILGTVAASGSSGASARSTARVSEPDFAAASARNAAVSVHSETAPKDEVQVSSPSANVAVFVSPFIRFDITARLAIVEIRNSDTGEVQQQYPSPRAVREYQQNLPVDSSLPSQVGQDSAESQPRAAGRAEDGVATTAPAPASTVTPPPSPTGAATTAAFSSLQGIPPGGKQVAVA